MANKNEFEVGDFIISDDSLLLEKPIIGEVIDRNDSNHYKIKWQTEYHPAIYYYAQFIDNHFRLLNKAEKVLYGKI